MLFTKKKHDLKRGDVVKIASITQKLEVTYVKTFWFSHDEITVIYQKKDGQIMPLSGFHPDSLVLANSKPRKKKTITPKKTFEV